MKSLPTGACFLAFLFVSAGAPEGAAFTLVRDGKPACSIIIAEHPTYNADYAAKELQGYVRKISGANLEIHSDAETTAPGSRILVGRSRLTDAIAGLTIPAGLTVNLREEGYVVHCKGDTLVLAGNDTVVGDTREDKIRSPICENSTMGEAMYLGTRYAVYDLLGRLGVHWFMPGEYGEVVPRSATLQVPELSVVERPDFAVRAYGIATEGEQMTRDLLVWLLHNRMNPRSVAWFGMVSDGSLQNLLPRDQIKAHPEWFALQPDGSRLDTEPCPTDELRRSDPKYAGQPRLLDEIMKKIAEPAKANQHVSDFAPADGAPACVCTLCRKTNYRFPDGMAYGPATEYATSQEYFFFVNRLLEAVHEKYPG
jgi:hypothetical protein